MRFCQLAASAVPLLLSMATGCDMLGPASIRGSRANYNSAVQQTGKEQLLLNIVRIRYTDPPLFFDITSVASQLSLSGSAGSSGCFGQFGSYSVTPGVSTGFSETPTITYAPLQGDNFVKQMMSPVSLEVIVSLYRARWDVRMLLAMCVDRFGTELYNPAPCGGTGRFAQVLDEFRALQQTGALDIAVRKGDTVDHKPGSQPIGPDELIFVIDPTAAPDSQRQAVIDAEARLRRLLPAASASSRPAETRPSHEDGMEDAAIYEFAFHLHRTANGCERETVDTPALRTRSVLGAMNYVADGVCLPAHDALATEQRIIPAGCQPIIAVYSAASPPPDAYVSVPYRGQSFYIADNDPRTKASFMLLFEIMGAQAAGLQNSSLLLTLPLNR